MPSRQPRIQNFKIHTIPKPDTHLRGARPTVARDVRDARSESRAARSSERLRMRARTRRREMPTVDARARDFPRTPPPMRLITIGQITRENPQSRLGGSPVVRTSRDRYSDSMKSRRDRVTTSIERTLVIDRATDRAATVSTG